MNMNLVTSLVGENNDKPWREMECARGDTLVMKWKAYAWGSGLLLSVTTNFTADGNPPFVTSGVKTAPVCLCPPAMDTPRTYVKRMNAEP